MITTSDRSRSRLRSSATALRRDACRLSVLVLCTALAALAAWTFAAGGGWRDLAVPGVGAVLAFAAEMLCVDAAIRRVERSVSPPERAPVGTARHARA